MERLACGLPNGAAIQPPAGPSPEQSVRGARTEKAGAAGRVRESSILIISALIPVRKMVYQNAPVFFPRRFVMISSLTG